MGDVVERDVQKQLNSGDAALIQSVKLRERYEQLVDELGIAKNVTFTGFCTHKAVANYLKKAHILLAPSATAEDGDHVILEAMASGVPVISTYHAGIPEVITDGVNDFLVPEHASTALANKVLHLLEHPELWSTIAKNGREYVERYHAIDTQAAHLEQWCYIKSTEIVL